MGIIVRRGSIIIRVGAGKTAIRSCIIINSSSAYGNDVLKEFAQSSWIECRGTDRIREHHTRGQFTPIAFVASRSYNYCPSLLQGSDCQQQVCGYKRSEEHTSELQSRQYLHSFTTRRSSDLSTVAAPTAMMFLKNLPRAAG